MLKPHMTCLGNDVYFGTFPLAQLTTVEARFLHECDGSRTLAECAKAATADAVCVARLSSWLLWWERPVPSAPMPKGPIDRLVLAARHTAPWLGMGGRLALDAASKRTLVVTCFGSLGENRFVEAFPSASEVSAACHDEVELVARLTGVQQQIWDFPDDARRQMLFTTGLDVDDLAADTTRAQVLDLIESLRPSEVFAPAALDSSADALLLFNTVLSSFATGNLEAELHFYEDAPVIDGCRPIDEFLARFENSYLAPQTYYVDIAPAFHEKSALASGFRCTIDQHDATAWLQSAARNGSLALPTTGFAERFWRLDAAAVL